ncbi:MAG: hypothetical protein ACOXZ4_04705 [Sphaerochaetaceae bacterium]
MDLLFGFGAHAGLRYQSPSGIAFHAGVAGNIGIFNMSVYGSYDSSIESSANIPYVIRPYISIGLDS